LSYERRTGVLIVGDSPSRPAVASGVTRPTTRRPNYER